MPTSPPPPDECAQCGMDLPRHARACPECGADERTGWRETSVYDGTDLPAAADDPHHGADTRPSTSLTWYGWATLAAVLVALIISALGH